MLSPFLSINDVCIVCHIDVHIDYVVHVVGRVQNVPVAVDNLPLVEVFIEYYGFGVVVPEQFGGVTIAFLQFIEEFVAAFVVIRCCLFHS